jgi:N utilization substance protein A
MNRELAAKLAGAAVKTRDDLAELAVDELQEIEPALGEEEAKALIMKARAHWFDGDGEKAA